MGPLPYNTSQTGQTGPVELEVTDLETNKMYSVTVTLLTSTGTANSTAYFGKSHALILPYTPYSTRMSPGNTLKGFYMEVLVLGVIL